MIEVPPHVARRRGVRAVPAAPVDRQSRDQRVRRRQLHADVVEIFQSLGIVEHPHCWRPRAEDATR